MKEEVFWMIRRGIVVFAKWLFITFALWLFAAIVILSIAGLSHFLSGALGLDGGATLLIVLSLVASGVIALFFCRD